MLALQVCPGIPVSHAFVLYIAAWCVWVTVLCAILATLVVSHDDHQPEAESIGVVSVVGAERACSQHRAKRRLPFECLSHADKNF